MRSETTHRRVTSAYLLSAAAAVAGVTAAYRILVFNGFANDHYMHLAWAEQVARVHGPGAISSNPVCHS